MSIRMGPAAVSAIVVSAALCGCPRQEQPEPRGSRGPDAASALRAGDGAAAVGDEATPAPPPVFSRDGITVTHVGGPGSDSEVSRERARPEITARADGGAVVVELSGYVYPCTARPLFGARLDGDTLIIFRDSYTGSLSRCAGFHRASLRIDGVPQGSYTISLRTERDMPLASTTVVLGARSSSTRGGGDASTGARDGEPGGSATDGGANQ